MFNYGGKRVGMAFLGKSNMQDSKRFFNYVTMIKAYWNRHNVPESERKIQIIPHPAITNAHRRVTSQVAGVNVEVELPPRGS
jgi:hypothetical protein